MAMICAKTVSAPTARASRAQCAGGVDRAAGDGVAAALRDRDGLAADHRLVDERLASHDHAVDRDPLSRSHRDDVAPAHRVDVELQQDAVALDAGRAGLELEQRADGVAGAPLGRGLEVAPYEDERDDDGRRLVVDVHRAGRQQPGGEGGDERVAVGGARADHDERVHVGRAAQQGRPALLEEAEPRPEHDAGGEHEEQVRHRLGRDQPV
jgi:hypothetical protein